ncbi:MAG TPA: DUF4252 domain-containing protein [Alphaproteobacteria bacterium]|nr:DUF4252 domain-containing protein [Alphaproteobacteria bacterium]
MNFLSRSKVIRGVLLGLLAISIALPGFAQGAKLELKNLDKLSSKASETTDIVLDGALLQLALKFMDAAHDPDADEVKSVIKFVTGIYIRNFEFEKDGQYDKADVELIHRQFSGPGWTKVIESRSKDETNEIFVMKQGDKIAGLGILVAEPRELTVVNIVGPIDLEKVAVLAGHLGIPSEINLHYTNKKKAPAETRHDKD